MVSNLESTKGVERWSDELLDSMRLRGDPAGRSRDSGAVSRSRGEGGKAALADARRKRSTAARGPSSGMHRLSERHVGPCRFARGSDRKGTGVVRRVRPAHAHVPRLLFASRFVRRREGGEGLAPHRIPREAAHQASFRDDADGHRRDDSGRARTRWARHPYRAEGAADARDGAAPDSERPDGTVAGRARRSHQPGRSGRDAHGVRLGNDRRARRSSGWTLPHGIKKSISVSGASSVDSWEWRRSCFREPCRKRKP